MTEDGGSFDFNFIYSLVVSYSKWEYSWLIQNFCSNSLSKNNSSHSVLVFTSGEWCHILIKTIFSSCFPYFTRVCSESNQFDLFISVTSCVSRINMRPSVFILFWPVHITPILHFTVGTRKPYPWPRYLWRKKWECVWGGVGETGCTFSEVCHSEETGSGNLSCQSPEQLQPITFKMSHFIFHMKRQKTGTVNWYLESSQPQRTLSLSGLKTNFNLSPSYSAH